METEAKFIVPDEATFARLKDLEQIGEYVCRNTTTSTVHDRYVDTPEQSFYGRRYFARLREAKGNGADAPLLVTIKKLGGRRRGAIHSREEYEASVPGLAVGEWPEGEARTLAEKIAGDAPLTDLVTIDQVRTVSTVYHEARAVAELSLDEITIQGRREPTKAFELEIELLPDGTMPALKALSSLLQAQYNLSPQPLSKFERAMLLTNQEQEEPATAVENKDAQEVELTGAETLKDETPREKEKEKGKGDESEKRVLPTDSVTAAARKLIGAFYSSMRKNEDGTRSGEDIEALHDMRVATRRMRAALRVMGGYLAGSKGDTIGRRVRNVTRALGAVRDLDVLIKHARSFQEQLPFEQRSDLDGLLGVLGRRRDNARDKLKRLLDSREYAQLKRRIEAFLEEDVQPPDQTEEAVPYQVRHAAGSAIWSRYEAVRAYETLMDAPTLRQLHTLRIKGKYLRYTLECFSDALPPDARALIEDMVKLQDQLGDLHDADVAAGLVRSYIEEHSRSGKKQHTEPLAGLLAYVGDREEAIRRLYIDFYPTWANIDGREWRDRLAALITAL